MTDSTLQETVLVSTPYLMVLGGQGSPTDGYLDSTTTPPTLVPPVPKASYSKGQIYNATTNPHPNNFTLLYQNLLTGDMYYLKRPDANGAYKWAPW